MKTKAPKKPKKTRRPAGGRPPCWEDRDAFQKAVDNYFTHCDKTLIIRQHVTGKGIIKVKTPTPYTMAGLARALDMSRETLNQYKREDTFSDIISCARAKIHEQNVTHAMLGCHDSRIAALNLASNYGYANRTESEVRSTGIEDILREMHKSREK